MQSLSQIGSVVSLKIGDEEYTNSWIYYQDALPKHGNDGSRVNFLLPMQLFKKLENFCTSFLNLSVGSAHHQLEQWWYAVAGYYLHREASATQFHGLSLRILLIDFLSTEKHKSLTPSNTFEDGLVWSRASEKNQLVILKHS